MTGPLQARIQAATPPVSAGKLTCQWCATVLPDGETRCPACGSPGIPDPTMQVPGAGEIVTALFTNEERSPEEILLEPEEWAAPPPPKPDTSDQILNNIVILAGCGIVFALLGAMLSPFFISPLIESVTGAPVERAADVRPMGGIAGLIAGLLIGATWGWISAADR